MWVSKFGFRKKIFEICKYKIDLGINFKTKKVENIVNVKIKILEFCYFIRY